MTEQREVELLNFINKNSIKVEGDEVKASSFVITDICKFAKAMDEFINKKEYNER